MAECYNAVLWAGMTFIIAWSFGSILGTLISIWFDKRQARKDRERMDRLMSDTAHDLDLDRAARSH